MGEGHDEIGATIFRRITFSITVKVDTMFKMNEMLSLTIKIISRHFLPPGGSMGLRFVLQKITKLFITQQITKAREKIRTNSE
jgi:hypothetical protein